jgi:hypothetical protein
MTRVLTVDENNDIYVGRNGRLAISAGLSAITQACEHAAKAQLGEMMFAVNRGIPNFETIWRGTPSIGQFDAALRAALLRVPGVTRVTGFNAERVGDVLQYAVTISTVEGEAIINGSL